MRVSSTWVLMAISQTLWLSWQEIMYQRISVKIKDILTLQIPALLEKQVIQLYPLYLHVHCTSSCLAALYNLWSEMSFFFFHSTPQEKNCWEIGCFSVSDELLFYICFLRICAYPVLLYDAGEGGRNHLDLRVEDSEIYESIMFPREFIFKLAPETSYSVQVRFTLILETFIVPRGMKLSALISNPDRESIFKIPWLQSMRLYSSLRVNLCQEMASCMAVPHGSVGSAGRLALAALALAAGQHSLGQPERCWDTQGVPRLQPQAPRQVGMVPRGP